MIEFKLSEQQYECLIDILSQLEKNHSVTTEFTLTEDFRKDKVFYRILCFRIEQTRSHLSKPNLPEYIRIAYTNLLDYYLKQKKEIDDYAGKNLRN